MNPQPTEMSVADWVHSIGSKIDTVQSPQNLRETSFTHDPTGLGAQISRRVLALRVAYMTGRRAVFPNESMYPYETCYLPLGGDSTISFKAVNDRIEFDFWKFWEDSVAREDVYKFLPAGLANSEVSQLLFEGILLSKMPLKDSYENYITAAKIRLNLEDPYIGLHYRRGDKKVETPYVPTKKYREEVIRIAKETGINKVFIASDSPAALRELNLEEAGLISIFDFDEIRYNNANHRFLMANQDKAKEETLTAIKNIYLLAGAKKVVGQTNAHFATLAAAMICYRDNTYLPGVLIPGEIQMNSPLIAIKYRLKNFVKNIVKKLFPALTLRAHKKKNG
jgi:hypothetical protein